MLTPTMLEGMLGKTPEEVVEDVRICPSEASNVIDFMLGKVSRSSSQIWAIMCKVCVCFMPNNTRAVVMKAVIDDRFDSIEAIFKGWLSHESAYVLGEAFILAIKKRKDYMFDFFLEFGVDVNHVSDTVHMKCAKLTPLMMAVIVGDVETVIKIVDKNPDLKKLSSDGTAMDIAGKTGNTEIIKCLQEYASASPPRKKRVVYKVKVPTCD